jgi:hypothetical protein
LDELSRKKDISTWRKWIFGELLRIQDGSTASDSHGLEQVVKRVYRTGTKYEYPENQLVTWIKGSILEPQTIKDKINSADVIVHTIGTLFDTSVTNKVKPGGPGTYEQINRDTLASLLEVLEKPKKIIYVSSAAHPPFLSRYLKAKYEAEELLFKS